MKADKVILEVRKRLGTFDFEVVNKSAKYLMNFATGLDSNLREKSMFNQQKFFHNCSYYKHHKIPL